MQKTLDFIHNYKSLPGFQNVVHDVGPPITQADIEEFQAVLQSLNEDDKASLLGLYGQARTLQLGFEHVSGSEVQFGGMNIFPFGSVFFHIGRDRFDQIAFDRTIDDRLVTFSERDGRLQLFVDTGSNGEEKPEALDLGVGEYLGLLDECRGLFPWQMAILSKKRGLMDDERKQFISNLSITFPDADTSLF
ncbi:hypothetical protein [Sinorhizobium prairiense]|uniref:hypothetical protein n=1 Tax=unclassified Sinorhizobium TaxID=2613772 RepID=UPI0023D851FE|nr:MULTISPECIES: hypothetical protein [unclassified Sinorhizobium]WEJ09951.1 hypothetical protein N0Q90_18235 [Sinorhizobium sp. M103]WEJ15497.1 hypothetical protein N0Q91_18940 [Sinorhizobium sp. K101]WEJ36914.1 hypothetical protein N0R80_18210 [Sinorhizobium sp. C101]